MPPHVGSEQETQSSGNRSSDTVAGVSEKPSSSGVELGEMAEMVK